MHPRNGTHPMARINYAIRAGSFAYSFLVLAVHGAEHYVHVFYEVGPPRNGMPANGTTGP